MVLLRLLRRLLRVLDRLLLRLRALLSELLGLFLGLALSGHLFIHARRKVALRPLHRRRGAWCWCLLHHSDSLLLLQGLLLLHGYLLLPLLHHGHLLLLLHVWLRLHHHGNLDLEELARHDAGGDVYGHKATANVGMERLPGGHACGHLDAKGLRG